MTSISELKTKFENLVFNHADILAITDKAYPRELTEQSEAEVTLAYDGSEVNFFEYVITKSEENYPLIGGSDKAEQIFTVDIRYTKQAHSEVDNFALCQSAIETLQTIIKSELGDTWGGTIDFIRYPITSESPTLSNFNETECFRANIRYIAVKQI